MAARRRLGSRLGEPASADARERRARGSAKSPVSSIANPSKPVQFAALRRATTRGKKIWGRKRHVLVDSQGNLLAVKVTGAHCSDQQGAKILLEPVKELFPKIKLLWGDSHYGGTLIGWLKE